MLIAVSFEPTVTLFVSFHDPIAAECLRAALEAVVFAVQLIEDSIQHLQKHITQLCSE